MNKLATQHKMSSFVALALAAAFSANAHAEISEADVLAAQKRNLVALKRLKIG